MTDEPAIGSITQAVAEHYARQEQPMREPVLRCRVCSVQTTRPIEHWEDHHSDLGASTLAQVWEQFALIRGHQGVPRPRQEPELPGSLRLW